MLRQSVIELFATTAWFIWTHHNKVRLREKTIPLGSIAGAASTFLQQFRSCRQEPIKAKHLQRRKWQPPEPGLYKLNFDGAMFNESNEAGIGIVVQESLGLVLVAMAEKIWKPHNVESLEMLAARRAIIFAKELGLQQGQFEGDSEICIKALQMDELFSSSYGHLVRDTLFHVNSFQSFSFSHTVR